MQTNKFFKLGLVAMFAILLGACQSSSDDMEEPGTQQPGTNTNTNTAPADPNGGLTSAQVRERDEALATTVFYFEFDRADLSAEARSALVHHANRLMANPSMRYRLEGHADERGTREYNLALGERRAQAIERYLQVQGVSAGQLEIISYGEERPADPATTEAAHARNRRVEIH